VVVLAGGASNRFWPLREKLLFRFGSQTLLERHLRQLRQLGCERFVIVASPENADAVGEIVSRTAVDAQVVIQPQPRGMADALLCAREGLRRSETQGLYVTQAHDVVDASMHAAVLEALSSGRGDGYIAAQRVTSYFPGGYLQMDGGCIATVVEKPGAGNEPSDLVNIVAHGFSSWRQLVEAIESTDAGEADDVYERALSSLMLHGKFEPVIYEERWQALKYPWHLLDVMEMLLDRWASGAESPGDDYENRDGAFYGRDVRVYPGAHVVAPALLGHGVIVGHNALVRGSIVGERSVIGFGSEVARSYLGEGVELHHNYVGDTVMADGSSMGFGATTANFRLDGRTVPSTVRDERIDSGRMKLGLVLGEGAKLGVNTSTMPGVKIGAGSIVGANLRITRDLPDKARILDERGYGRYQLG
jgi:bifunctional UDP-N-acetylglucosamine pyrophosphorylase/glucosamine-1-phosphate N-acetyltransferase